MAESESFEKKVFDTFSLAMGSDFTVDESIKAPICVISEIFLRYLIAQTVDCMAEEKENVEYDDIHRAIHADRGLSFLTGAFQPQNSLEKIRQKRSKKSTSSKKISQIIELD